MKWQEIRDRYPYLYETHLHTSQTSACAKCSGEEMALAAKKYGYTGIFVTDHNWGGNTRVDSKLPWKQWVDAYCAGYLSAAGAGEKLGLDVFFGMEAGYSGTEFLLYGIDGKWLKEHPEIKTADVETLYRKIKETGGMMIHAHPFREEYYIPKIRLYPEHVDGVEGVNATHSNPASTGHNDPEYDVKALAYAKEHSLPLTAGSDIHSVNFLGGGMAFKRRLASVKDFIQAVTGEEDYILTNGDNCYTRYGVLM